MSDNINFIPAAELPVAEGMIVEALCIENGELKRSANGAGGGYIIHVPADEITEDEENGMTAIMLSESYDNFAPILAAGGSVWLDLSNSTQAKAMGAKFAIVPVTAAFFLPELGGFIMMGTNHFTNNMIQIMCPNGTWSPD